MPSARPLGNVVPSSYARTVPRLAADGHELCGGWNRGSGGSGSANHVGLASGMPAMLMPFRVENAADLTVLYPGARIQFELAVTKGQAVARHIRRSGRA